MNRLRKHPSSEVKRLVKQLVRYSMSFRIDGKMIGFECVFFVDVKVVVLCCLPGNGRILWMNG